MRGITWKEFECSGDIMGKQVARSVVLSSFSAACRRVLLWGVPSLALLGVVGMASWRWLRRHKRSDTNTPAAPACCKCDSASPPEGLERSSPSSEDSGVGSQACSSRKASQEDLSVPAGKDKMPAHLVSQLSVRRSSNFPQDSEAPLKPPAASDTNKSIPSIENESFSEMDSTSSSDGLLSLPSKSPTEPGKPSPPELPAGSAVKHPVPASLPDGTNHTCSASTTAASTPYQPKQGNQRADTDPLQGSKGMPKVGRRDRVRITIHIPREVVGRFIGKQGRNIKALMVDSYGAHVYVNQKNAPSDSNSVLCTVQGTSEQVEEAVKIIGAKYPEIEIPMASLTGLESSVSPSLCPISPFPCPLFTGPSSSSASSAATTAEDPWEVRLLPAQAPPRSFSAMASFIESMTHVWLVTWEKSSEVDRMHDSMSSVYKRCGFGGAAEDGSGGGRLQPRENDESLLGKFCAVRVSEIHWLRGRVTRLGDCMGTYEVQLVDYGSIVLVPSSSIRPLRREYAVLPVQAIKAKIAHVECKDSKLSLEGMTCLMQMLEGRMMEVHVTSTLPFSDVEEAGRHEEEEGTVLPSLPVSADASPVKKDSLNAKPDLDSPEAVIPAAAPPSSSTTTSSSPALTSLKPASSGKLDPMAPYMPVVELYVQQGAQTPTFVNREIVELGYASWKEVPVQTSPPDS